MTINESKLTTNVIRNFNEKLVSSETTEENKDKESFFESLKQMSLREEITLDKHIIVQKDNHYTVLKNKEVDLNEESQTLEDFRVQETEGNEDILITNRTLKTTEEISLTTRGYVKTADGREIRLNFNLDFHSQLENNYKSKSTLADPLVVNFDSPMATLNKKRISFDINSDGHKDSIINLNKGSGFLAIDKNNDGIINNGTELFGATSGLGFNELRYYDKDKNGWIDENDIVFDALKILTFNDDGTQELVSIREKDMGAFYLGDQATNYSQQNLKGEKLATTTSSSFFFKENGDVGTTQQVNLNVKLGYKPTRTVTPREDEGSMLKRLFARWKELENLTEQGRTTLEQQTITVTEEEVNTQTSSSYKREETNITVKTEEEEQEKIESINELTQLKEDEIRRDLLEMEDRNLETILKMADKE